MAAFVKQNEQRLNSRDLVARKKHTH